MPVDKMSRKRSPSPSPTVTLDVNPKPELYRSSSEESIRVVHHAVLFPNSPYAGRARVAYITRAIESDAELVKRQLAAIALQPLTFAEELASKRKQLEIKAENRKREKEKAAEAKANNLVPEIAVIPASGKHSPGSVTPKLSPRNGAKSPANISQQNNSNTFKFPPPRQQFRSPSRSNIKTPNGNGSNSKKNKMDDIVTGNFGEMP